MSKRPFHVSVTRRHCIALGLTPWLWGQVHAAVPSSGPRLLVLGDSLSAEYGLPRGRGWVALLEARLLERAPDTRVVNASISGETTSGGRARLPALLDKHQPTHVVIELGANDALRGLPLDATREHLRAMIRLAQARGAKVLIAGMQVPPNYGARYTRDFAQVFGDVARSEKTALVPFLLDGLADAPDPRQWFQSDGLHPTAAAQPRILANVWSHLAPWLGATTGR